MNVLVTGGAGSLGKEIVSKLAVEHPDWRIVVYSRDEGKQAAMRQEIPEGGSAGVRYMLGDICDTERLSMAMQGIDHVYHCAALKMIDACQYDSIEATRVNVSGTVSVVKSCIRCGVKRAVIISTDKAPDPCGVYGKTKSLAESIWVLANGLGRTEFVAVRYGNVIGSAKSAFHKWRSEGTVTVTDPDATRFYWRLTEARDFVLHVMMDHAGTRGETYIPRMRSYRIVDIAAQYDKPINIIGWRCPEKRHERLWTEWENDYVTDQGDHYCLYPAYCSWTDSSGRVGEPVGGPVTSETYTKEIPAYLR